MLRIGYFFVNLVMKKIIPFIILLCCFYNTAIQAQCGERFVSPVFDELNITYDVQYGSNINSDGNMQDLYFDIYEPANDPMEMRPVIVFAFGGAFVAGSKDSPDIVYLCEEFAKLGYVTVSMQYRIESNQLNLAQPDAMVKAVMRATQDGWGILRYLRQDAATENLYNLDPEQIFMGGSSAGALLAMHVAYMNNDDANDMPSEWVDYVEELGGWDGISGPEGYDQHVNGIISMAGALGQLNFIDEGDEPIISFHSTGDETVPYESGFPLGIPFLPTLYGSSPTHERATQLGIINELHTYEDANHPPYNDGMVFQKIDEMVVLASAFLYDLIACPQAEILASDSTLLSTVCDTLSGAETMVTCIDSIDVCSSVVYAGVDTAMTCEVVGEETITILENVGIEDINNGFSMHVYPNPVENIFVIELPEGSNQVTSNLFNQSGQLVKSTVENSNTIVMNRDDLPSGVYYLEVINENMHLVEKVILR